MIYDSFKIGRWGQIGWEYRRNRIGPEQIVTVDGTESSLYCSFQFLIDLKFFFVYKRGSHFKPIGGTALSP